MDDLISRAEAIEAATDWHVKPDGEIFSAIKAASRSKIEQLPVVDAVPVIRCRDCAYWETDWKPNHSIDGEHFCPMISLVTYGEWFCAYGERMESE